MNPTEQTLELLRQALAPQLGKAGAGTGWTQPGVPTSGISSYDLEEPAKMLFPVLTPLRNSIPRKGGGQGTAVNWRAVTGINTNKLSVAVAEGSRAGLVTTTTQDFVAAYKTIGLADSVTFEAEFASQGFQDLKALAALDLLNATMIGEEMVILGGNNSLNLGTCPTPVLAAVASGGNIPASTAVYVLGVALTLDGVYASSVAGGVNGLVTRTNDDGSTTSYGGYSGQISAPATITTGTGSGNSVTASVASVTGALGYAWFWGASAAAATLGAITTINSVVITTSAGTGTQTPGTTFNADNSLNALYFNGILPTVFTAANNAYVGVQATGTAGTGTPLTADGYGGVVEIDAALKSFWDNYRLSPQEIWVSSQEQKNITNKMLQSTSTNAQRLMVAVPNDRGLMGGFIVKSYLNKYSMSGGQAIEVNLHPNLPPGTLFFRTTKLPYKLNNVPSPLQIRTRRDYYQIEWPLVTRKYQYGVYSDEVLQHYFPPAFGAITNIGNG